MQQEQFLQVLDRDEAERRFHAVLDLRPLPAVDVRLAESLGRVLANDIVAPVDVPCFDRADVDGFAVRAEDTFGATEDRPRPLRLNAEEISPGGKPRLALEPESATSVATGSMLPRCADAVVMIEDTELAAPRDDGSRWLLVRRAVTPGGNITFTGTDIGCGELVLRHGELLTARETGVLAALGLSKVRVVRRPRVAIYSTGDEIVAPGSPLKPGLVYDSNATILSDTVRELGAEAVPGGIVPDDADLLRAALAKALHCDVVLLSGGTSKGAGDISYRVVAELGQPGIVAHGVALKPGKPLCLAAIRIEGEGRVVPVVVLPGFPTSAIFTFREFVAPVIRRLGGRSVAPDATVEARLPMRVNSERGRTEYLLVGLVSGEGQSPIAYPMGKGSGSVTTFSKADGFVIIPREREYVDVGTTVTVHLLAQGLQPADLVVIGSHCVGLDYLLGRLQEQGLRSKFLAVGSRAGLEAARRGECDLAGIHLLDPVSSTYNRSFLDERLTLIPGYGRLQGLVFRRGDRRFEDQPLVSAVQNALGDASCILVNRNRGSGTRILIDRLLGFARPPGWLTEAKSHNAVAAAISQHRADWGVAIASVARSADLGFLSLQSEEFDFVVPSTRIARPGVRAFRALLEDEAVRKVLANLGFQSPSLAAP